LGRKDTWLFVNLESIRYETFIAKYALPSATAN
jgi:hypothetical protein